MQDVLYIDDAEQAAALLKPLRIELLRRMAEPRTLSELSNEMGDAPQKLHYHVKTMERAGLVDKVAARRAGGVMEGLYQATARTYWISPRLVGRIGGARRARDQASLDFLLTLAEDLQLEVVALSQRVAAGEETPSLGLSATVELQDAGRRAAFMRDVQSAIQAIAEKYAASQSDGQRDERNVYKLSVACYPAPVESPCHPER